MVKAVLKWVPGEKKVDFLLSSRDVKSLNTLFVLGCLKSSKRKQLLQVWISAFVKPTTPNISGYYMLRPFEHRVACCCVLLGCCCAKFETGRSNFWLRANGRNNS